MAQNDRGIRLLAVGDDTELRSILVEFLRRRGFEVEYEREGSRALARAFSERFDLAVLDGAPGIETLRKLREESQLPVLLLTTGGAPGERIQGLEWGADDCLPKPFDPNELLARIRAILRRVATARRSFRTLQIGELRLRPGVRDAWFRGRRLQLTGTEYDILECLMRSFGCVVSRDELSFLLYRRPASPFDRAIDTHISRIRKKLGEGRTMILSVRGNGYQLRYPPEPAECKDFLSPASPG